MRNPSLVLWSDIITSKPDLKISHDYKYYQSVLFYNIGTISEWITVGLIYLVGEIYYLLIALIFNTYNLTQDKSILSYLVYAYDQII